jgi:DNA mismatch repair ATPase MutS
MGIVSCKKRCSKSCNTNTVLLRVIIKTSYGIIVAKLTYLPAHVLEVSEEVDPDKKAGNRSTAMCRVTNCTLCPTS